METDSSNLSSLDSAHADVRHQYYGGGSATDAPTTTTTTPNQQYTAYSSDINATTKYTEDAIQHLIHSNNYELRRTQSTKSPMWSCYRRIYNKQFDHYTGWIVCLVCRQRKPMHPKSPVREFEEHAAICMRTEAGAAIRSILAEPGSFDVRISNTRNGVTQEVLNAGTLRQIAKVAQLRVGGDSSNKSQMPLVIAAAANSNGGRVTRSVGHSNENVGDQSHGVANTTTEYTVSPMGNEKNLLVKIRTDNKRSFDQHAYSSSSSAPAAAIGGGSSGGKPLTRSSIDSEPKTPLDALDAAAVAGGPLPKRLAVSSSSSSASLERGHRQQRFSQEHPQNGTSAEPPVSPGSLSSLRLTYQHSQQQHPSSAAADAITAAETADTSDTTGAVSSQVKSIVMLRYNVGKGWADAVPNECCVMLPAKPISPTVAGERVESLHLTALREVVEEEGKALDAEQLRFRLAIDGISAVNKLVNAGFYVKTFIPLFGDEVCYLLESNSTSMVSNSTNNNNNEGSQAAL